MNGLEYALTFDDILLVPRYSEVIPSDVSLASEFAQGKKLQVPLVVEPIKGD